jgi:fused signal recognition particle receptor
MLGKLASALQKLFTKTDTAHFFDDLEDTLIEADLGAVFAATLRQKLEKSRVRSMDDTLDMLKKELLSLFPVNTLPFTPHQLNFFLFLGVNGVGKTTSLAKLAHYIKQKKITQNIVCACGDTFRAAAVEQLTIHSERVGFRIVKSSQGSDPGAVIHDTITSAMSHKEELILADTAGRMHNKTELVNELKKIDKIISSRIDPRYYQRILVIDATTGQNGIRQAELFHQAVNLTGVILTKYDSSAKAGAIISIVKNLGIPIYFVGTGETMQDLHPFVANDFIQGLLS